MCGDLPNLFKSRGFCNRMKKRIAIQLFGHLRTFKETASSFFKKVIIPNQAEGYEIDIFIHTWDEKEHSDINFSNPNGDVIGSKMLTKEEMQKVIELYAPKKFIFDKQEKIKEEIYIDKAGNKRSTKTFCNLSKTLFMSNKLREDYEKENKIKYDWVIVTRPDIEFLREFKISSFLSTYTEWKTPLPQTALFYGCSSYHWEENWYPVEIKELITCNDLILFSKPEIIDKAMDVYPNWKKYFQKKEIYTIEKMFMDYWKNEGLNPIAVKYRPGKEFRIRRLPSISGKANRKERLKAFLFNFLVLIIKIIPYFIAVNLLRKDSSLRLFLRKLNKMTKKTNY